MGMAASQARFLGLTARKNNVEYEGQQINQQRTSLANQTANYYNDLLGMSVPTPPSVADYTKTVYSFNDGALTNQITSLIAQPGGAGYKVSYLQQHEDDFTPVKDGMAVVSNEKYTYDFYIGNDALRFLGVVNKDVDGLYIGTPKNDYLSSLTADQIIALQDEEQQLRDLLNEKYPYVGSVDWFVRYVENTTTGEMEPRFYNLNEVVPPFFGGDAVYDEYRY